MICSNKIFQINPENPQKAFICEAARIIRAGGLVIFPAKCLYAIGADALNCIAVEKIFKLKRRPENKPILVFMDDSESYDKVSRLNGAVHTGCSVCAYEIHMPENKNNSIKYFVKSIPLKAELLMRRFWPGDLTVVFEAKKHLPVPLTAGTGKIGIRIPGHPVARALVIEAKKPVTGTSANISGTKGCSSIKDISQTLLKGVDMILDAGVLKGGKGSTVVDVTVEPLKILREGELSEREILAGLEQFY